MFSKKSRYLVLLLIIGLLVVGASACKKQAGGGKDVQKIVVAYSSIVDLGDVPSLLAWETLRSKGIEVVPKFMTSGELAIEAVMRGDAHIGNSGVSAVNIAQIKGADLKVFVLQTRVDWALIGRGDVKKLSDLDGKKLAQHSPQSDSKAWTDVALKERAPNVKPQEMIIPGSENRAEALLRAAIDASPVELADVVNLEAQQPGNFNILVSFAEELKGMQYSPFFASAKFLKDNKAAAKAMIEALLQVHRRIADDPNFLKEQAPKYLPNYDPALLPKALELYRHYEIWPVNGGLELDGQKWTTEFFIRGGKLPEGTKWEPLYDRVLLDEVLKSVGSK
ncbi:MAG: ABC transporter substrate-binding protein [Firmicutes bacterium]|nr:ABC transporter substrate-binding protein [Bacillota bacterium]